MKKIKVVTIILIFSIFTISFYNINPVLAESILLDSLTEDNLTHSGAIYANHPSSGSEDSAVGQSFTTPEYPSYYLDSVVFYVYKTGINSRYITAQLYEHSGVYGSSSVPTGSVLAESDLIDVLDIDEDYELVTFTFSGENRIELDTSTYYCICIIGKSGLWIPTSSNRLYIGEVYPSAHSGNAFYYDNNAWSPISVRDVCFYIYGEEIIIDSDLPFYSNLELNNTSLVNSSCFSSLWNDLTSDLLNYTFGWNFTNEFVNDTSVEFEFGSSSQWVNITKYLGSDILMINQTIIYQIWVCDIYENWNTTEIQYFTITYDSNGYTEQELLIYIIISVIIGTFLCSIIVYGYHKRNKSGV